MSAKIQYAPVAKEPRDPPPYKRPSGCVCDGHHHLGGVGGCYLKVQWDPALYCPCRWSDDG